MSKYGVPHFPMDSENNPPTKHLWIRRLLWEFSEMPVKKTKKEGKVMSVSAW